MTIKKNPQHKFIKFIIYLLPTKRGIFKTFYIAKELVQAKFHDINATNYIT